MPYNFLWRWRDIVASSRRNIIGKFRIYKPLRLKEELMQSEVEQALTVLVGKRLWASRRAADMSTFQFGARIKTQDFYGRPCEVGEHALHVQCPWRIVQGVQLVVGSGDLYFPANFEDSESLPSDFEWDRAPNRRDRLLGELFDGDPEFVVQKIETSALGSFRLVFHGGMLLEVFPDDSLRREHWRLLNMMTDGADFVAK